MKRPLSHRMDTVASTALGWIALVLAGAVLVLNLLYTATVSYDGAEMVSTVSCLPVALGLLALAVGVPWLYTRLGGRLPRISARGLFLILSLVYTAGAVYLIANVPNALRADAYTVSSSARQIGAGIYTALYEGGYLHRYPHQAGLMVYDMLLYRIWDNNYVHFFTNFGLVLGINLITYKLADHLYGDPRVNCLTVLCCFAFLPQFFFILFAYGLIPGLFCMMLAFYAALRYAAAGRKRHLAVMTLALGAAVCFKQNYLIGGVAIAIYFILQMLRQFRHRQWVALLAVVFALLVPARLVLWGVEQGTHVTLDQGCPSVLWIAMGTDPDNNERAPGWYNGYNYAVYTEAEYDSAAAAAVGTAKVKENLAAMAADPLRAAHFFYDKTVSQWCDPLYGSVWTGPLEDCGQVTDTRLLQSLYNGGVVEDIAALWCKGVVLVLLAGSVLFLLRHRRDGEGWELLFLFFIGGFLFHLVWEGKSQYIYPYLYVLIPCGMYALGRHSRKGAPYGR